MSTRVMLSLFIAACVAGCASPQRAPRDDISAAQSEQELEKSRQAAKQFISYLAQAAADAEIKDLKPQLDLTPEQELAFRKAFTQQFEDWADELPATVQAMFTRKPPVAEPALPRMRSKRELWEPVLTPQQLAAYDAFKAAQRKEEAAKLAAEHLNRIDSPLGLTDDQRNRVSEIFIISEEQRLTAWANLEPTPYPDMEHKELAMVLTPAQLRKYEKLYPSRSNTQKRYAGGFFIPPTFTLPHASFSGFFKGR